MNAKRLSVIILAASVFAALLVFRSGNFHGQEYRSFDSPDGRFKVVVYRSRYWQPMMPGQSGDAPGTVRLYEMSSGKLLEQTRVEMVQLVELPEWSSTNVNIKLVADWQLP